MILLVLNFQKSKYVFAFIIIPSHLHNTISKFNLKEELTYWGKVTHICISKLAITGSDNGLSLELHQVIIWTNAEILLIGPLRTDFSENLIKINTLFNNKIAFENVVWKMVAILSQPQCVNGEMESSKTWETWKKTNVQLCNCIVSLDDLAILGTWKSAGTGMTKFEPCIYARPDQS